MRKTALTFVVCLLIAWTAGAQPEDTGGGATIDGGTTNHTTGGDTTVLATESGAMVSGNCRETDANGNAVDSGAACGGDLVSDTTPQLGGQLDVNGFCLGDGTLELWCFSETASAVNELTATNAATGGKPSITPTGDDAAIGFNLLAKSTDPVCLGGNSQADPLCVSNDGTNSAIVVQPDTTQAGNSPVLKINNAAGANFAHFDTQFAKLDLMTGVAANGLANLILRPTGSAGTYIQFVNATTGYSQTTDGYFFGLSANEEAVWWNLDSAGLDMVIEQEGGETMHFVNAASAVNYWTVAGSATGADLTMAVDGSDANAGADIAGKGTGLVSLSSNVGASPPATCTAGTFFIDTDETDDTNCTTTADNSLCLCVAADMWVALENN